MASSLTTNKELSSSNLGAGLNIPVVPDFSLNKGPNLITHCFQRMTVVTLW